MSGWESATAGGGRRGADQQNRAAVSFGDSDIVRSAVRVEGFRDEEFDYQLIKAMGVADYGGSTIGECLAVAAEITDGSPQSWARASTTWPIGWRPPPVSAWRPATGSAAGITCSGRRPTTGRRVLRGPGRRGVPSHRGAEPGVLRGGRVADAAAGRAGGCALRGIEMPGVLPAGAAPGSGRAGNSRRLPTLVCVGGFDSSAEELYFHYGAPGAERGWNVFAFDGPGQPGCMRLDPGPPVPARLRSPDGGARRDRARDDVDPDRLALVGESLAPTSPPGVRPPTRG